MSLIQVGLIDMTGKIDPELVQAAAAALNVQVSRDLPQFWPVHATVRYLPHGSKVPTGVWAVQLVRQLPPGEGGFHTDLHHQPYSKVIAAPGGDDWTIDASHEVLEMLVDPYGNKLHASRSIRIVKGKIQDGPGEFEYLVEACDPCEANKYGYSIQGIAVSDFITPRFYDPVVTPAARYSFTGSIKAPRQILPGGYISFLNSEMGEWQQILYVDPSKPPQLVDLGPASGASLRVWIDKRTHAAAKKHAKPNRALAAECRERRERLSRAAMVKARLY